jgi:peptide/nickel transport system ATP-binding protein
MLTGKNLTFAYRKGRPVLRNVSIHVEPGERVALVAPSGYGKSTLVRLLSGQARPQDGQVLVDGEEGALRKRPCPVQLIYQHPEHAVDPKWRMGAILNESWQVDGDTRARLGIRDEWLRRYPGELSGGELQRFCIARALGPSTRYLIADEITTMLDANTQAMIWAQLLDETDKRNIGLLVVTHNRALAARVCTRIVALQELNAPQEA